MRYAVTASEMQRCDTCTAKKYGVPSIVLMERAALAVYDRLRRGDFDLTRVLAVCGTGNNGGDGMAVARMLYLAGVPVTVCVLGNVQRMSSQASLQMAILKNYGVRIVAAGDHLEESEYIGYTTVVDGMFGVGLSREMGGVYAEMARIIGRMEKCRVLAVDIPSGIDATTGAVLGTAVRADVTVTFAYEKLGLLLFPGADYAGEVCVADIGITDVGFEGNHPACRIWEMQDLSERLPKRSRRSNKGTYGKVLIAAGSRGMAGAAALAARAAYGAGCGLVRICSPECNREILQQLVPEATVASYEEGHEAEVFERCLDWADSVVFGPGMGVSAVCEELLKMAARQSRLPLVIDADGITMLAGHPEWAPCLAGRCVLTPHPGEMARLMGCRVGDILNHMLMTAREGAARWQAVCLLKDARTVIASADPKEPVYLNMSGCDGMAVGGSGDTLSGIIGTWLAQGMGPLDAAAAGAYVHGLAGEWCQQEKGARSMTAGGLSEGLAFVLRKLDEEKKGRE